MKVYPTKKWTTDIVIPKQGIVRRPSPQMTPQVVMSSIGKWLIENGYATQSPPQKEETTSQSTSEKSEVETSDVQEEFSEDDKRYIIHFLENSSVEEIANTKYIGKHKATAISSKAQESGLIWEDVESNFNVRQKKALQERVNKEDR